MNRIALDRVTKEVMAWAGVALAGGHELEAELSAYSWLSHPEHRPLHVAII